MDAKIAIKKLIGIDVTTSDIKELWEMPEVYTNRPEDAVKLRELIKFIDDAKTRGA